MINVQTRVNGLLGLATKAGKISFGMQAVEESIEKNNASLVIIANDIAEASSKKIVKVCKEKNIDYIFFGTIEENSSAIGKYNKAIIAVKDKNFAEAILKIFNGGDTTWRK